jgi:hypothetical protein
MEARMAGKMHSVEPTIDPSAAVRESTLGAYCEVGARTILDWNHETLRRALPDFRKLGARTFLPNTKLPALNFPPANDEVRHRD